MVNKGGAQKAVRTVAYSAVMGGIMVMGQVLMAGLPNIEPVSLLVMMYTLYDKRLARGAIATFVLLEGVLYGFHAWWVTYLYIWLFLHLLTLATQKFSGPLFNALLSGAFGLLFGALTSPPYFIAGGFAHGVAYIIAGIPFDLLHCAGNFLLALLLFKPLHRMFGELAHRQANQQ